MLDDVFYMHPSNAAESYYTDIYIMFFHSNIFLTDERSTKDEVRFSLVGMWNDATYLKFKAPKPEFKSRTFSAKDYVNQLQSGN